MLFEVRDQNNGTFYRINGNQIAYFYKEPNMMGVMNYFIVMSNNLKIALPAKRWRRIQYLLNKQ
jgi:hypothetical protein